MKKLTLGLGLLLLEAATHAAGQKPSLSTDDRARLRRLLEHEPTPLNHQETNVMNKRTWGVRGIR